MNERMRIPPVVKPVPKTGLILFCAGIFAIGAGTSAYWLGKLHSPERLWQQLPVLVLCLGLTLVLMWANVGLRWLRWHFLIRRFDSQLTTRDSLLVYASTFLAILTPFYIGELSRALLLRRKYPRLGLPVAVIWLLERSSDALVLGLFISLLRGQHVFLLICAGLWLSVVSGIKVLCNCGRLPRFSLRATLPAALLTTGAAWVLPGIALWGVLQLLQSPLSLPSTLGSFSYSTLAGSMTGAPLGVGVAGPLLIRQLQEQGLPLATVILGTAILRWGTAWFALAMSGLAAFAFRHQLTAILRADHEENHFEQIAEEYENEIPTHMRERLLARKIAFMQRDFQGNLESEGNGLDGQRGLDIGCGQGWYACEMASVGCEMYGLDQATQQVSHARLNARRRGVTVDFQASSAATLPFPDNYFSFAYAINVMHHITEAETRGDAFEEIMRVLKPGGTFYLHEINTTNPLFRFYMGYVFPVLRAIDEGTEKWIRPDALPAVAGGGWQREIDYFTFLPDFLPAGILERGAQLERSLERSRWRSWSAHYMARLVKQGVLEAAVGDVEPEIDRMAA